MLVVYNSVLLSKWQKWSLNPKLLRLTVFPLQCIIAPHKLSTVTVTFWHWKLIERGSIASHNLKAASTVWAITTALTVRFITRWRCEHTQLSTLYRSIRSYDSWSWPSSNRKPKLYTTLAQTIRHSQPETNMWQMTSSFKDVSNFLSVERR